MPSVVVKSLQRVSLLFLLCITVGCAANSQQDLAGQPSKHQISDIYKEGEGNPLDVYDPLGAFNRDMYNFNAAFDEYVFLPVVDTYEAVTPGFVRTGISNFFTNIGEIITFANEVLQFKFEAASKTVFRFATNSTLGFFGFFDITSDARIARTKEDFGQTLGFWGAGEGPFLVLPILGPSNLRDTVGFATDTAAFSLVDPLTLSSKQTEYPAIFALNVINQRYTQPLRYYETGSPFEYDLIRFLYTEKRRADIEK